MPPLIAVHLVSIENLTTNNCITAIRYFIARRDTPKLLISDSATSPAPVSNYAQNQLTSTKLPSNATNTQRKANGA